MRQETHGRVRSMAQAVIATHIPRHGDKLEGRSTVRRMDKPLQNHLTTADAHALVDSYSEFGLFERDPLNLVLVRDLEERVARGREVSLFHFTITTGSGGGVVVGSSGFLVATTTLRGGPFPHVSVHRKTLVNRVKYFLQPRIPGADKFASSYILTSDEPEAARSHLRPELGRFMAEVVPAFEWEVRGATIVAYHVDDREDRAQMADEVAHLAQLLETPAYR